MSETRFETSMEFLAVPRVGIAIATETNERYGRIMDYDAMGFLINLEIHQDEPGDPDHKLIWFPWHTIAYIFHPRTIGH